MKVGCSSDVGKQMIWHESRVLKKKELSNLKHFLGAIYIISPLYFFSYARKQGRGGRKSIRIKKLEHEKLMSFQIVLFCMQIISEVLISINAWATLNAFNFQSQPAEE